ncbi:MAG: SDR family oxidoreductase [Phycisphaerales bacterium]|nr:SDR family oxidoreductase [Phycisphaerales bacterium]
MPHTDADTIFLTGATGYIGGRLAPRLVDRGYHLRCLVRSLAKGRARPWSNHPNVELIEGDASDQDRLEEAMRGCAAAYYLIHSMDASNPEFHERDMCLARTCSQAAARASVERIIYLGGLGETGSELSKHLSSRQEVEQALRTSGVPVTVLRAAMIIGSGSASFEILRYLTERLPVMITPRWVSTECQPIAVRDVLHYLIAALESDSTTGRVIDIGGPDILNYASLMRLMAKTLGLPKRLIIPVPVLTPKLSSLWIHLVTPIDSGIARPLAEGLRNRVVCRDKLAQELMPHHCLPVEQAIDAALLRVGAQTIETSWSDAGVMPGDPDWAGGTVYEDKRSSIANATPEQCWKAIVSLGGSRGYFASNWLWRIRGVIDRLIGGPGLRRGRRSATELGVGDALDFWRVTTLDTNKHMMLTAEMRLPGIATLSFRLEPIDDQPPSTRITMTARFRPSGLIGILYWFSVLPLHSIVFRGMLKGIVRESENRENAAVPD